MELQCERAQPNGGVFNALALGRTKADGVVPPLREQVGLVRLDPFEALAFPRPKVDLAQSALHLVRERPCDELPRLQASPHGTDEAAFEGEAAQRVAKAFALTPSLVGERGIRRRKKTLSEVDGGCCMPAKNDPDGAAARHRWTTSSRRRSFRE